MIIDTHCHLFIDNYDESIFEELKNENIKVIINGYNLKTNKEALMLSEKYDFVYCSIGFHPNEQIIESNIKFLENNIQTKKVLAIGEIGLDYYRNKENKEIQKKYFIKQLELAKKYNKLVIIHNREATQDLYEILSKYNLKGILHAFSGSLESALNFIKLGYKLGIGGVITFKNSKLRDVIKIIDLKDIVLETDSPYLTPEPFRGEKNSPVYIKYILEEISKIKQINVKTIEKEIYENTKKLFDL